MHPNEGDAPFGNRSLDQREMMRVVDHGTIHVQIKLPKFRRQLDHLFAGDQLLAASPISDQIGDAADLQLMLLAKAQQFREARHGAIRVEDFAKDGCGCESGQPCKIDARFGVTGAPQDTARLCAQRKDMTRLHQIVRRGFRIDENADRMRAVIRADPRGHAFGGVDRDGKIGAIAFPILKNHAAGLCRFALPTRRRFDDDHARSAEMKSIARCAWLVAACTFTATARADEADWRVSAGAAIIATPEYPGSDDDEVQPLPAIEIEYDHRLFLNASRRWHLRHQR